MSEEGYDRRSKRAVQAAVQVNGSFNLLQTDFFLIIYLRGRVIERRERKKSSIHWYAPQMATIAGAGLIRSQELLSSGSPTRVQETKHVGHQQGAART